MWDVPFTLGACRRVSCVLGKGDETAGFYIYLSEREALLSRPLLLLFCTFGRRGTFMCLISVSQRSSLLLPQHQ